MLILLNIKTLFSLFGIAILFFSLLSVGEIGLKKEISCVSGAELVE